jgi:signal transduction histidine kinase
VHRTQTTTLVFALVAALVTVVSAVLAYQGLRAAFEREFESRLAKVAAIAASQVSAEDAADVQRLGAESGGFFALQAQLDMLRSVTGFENLAFVDSARATLYDVRLAEHGLLARSPYDSLAPAALDRALHGTPALASYRRGGRSWRAAFAPVRGGRRVVGVLVAEDAPAWQEALAGLRRRMVTILLFSVAAIAVLAGIVMRATGRRLALEQRLTRAENLAAMGRLTATLAHEIKNPLAVIRGSARRLGKLEPEAQRMADSLVEEVDRLNRTVSRYLQFARGEHDAEGRGDLAVAVGATLDLLEDEFRARATALERTGVEGPLVVRLDAESLRQLALNLVLNALEAQPEGGRVRVALERRGGDVELRVRDDGPGIPAEVMARLGEPFVTTKAQGTGLGLFLARRLVEGAGGELHIASPPGEGAAVTVRLPLAPG